MNLEMSLPHSLHHVPIPISNAFSTELCFPKHLSTSVFSFLPPPTMSPSLTIFAALVTVAFSFFLALQLPFLCSLDFSPRVYLSWHVLSSSLHTSTSLLCPVSAKIIPNIYTLCGFLPFCCLIWKRQPNSKYCTATP